MWDCGKPWQAVLGLLLLASMIYGGNVGVVIGLLFFEAFWALALVGHRDAYREAQEFVRAVQLYQAARRY
jgi:hypothetical protein